ncbi:hypothetical protein LP417_31805 [Polaromonas sp. P1-6]|nr:hypothetical protein LP417_31805 [Polaromonas sp. P1-6]
MHRPRSPQDHAWPSGTSASVFALLRLHELTGRDSYRDRAEHVFQMYGAAAAKNSFGFSHLLAARDFSQRPVSIVLAGDRGEAAPLVEAVHRSYHPARSGVCRGCSDWPGSAPSRRPARCLRVPKPNLRRAGDERAGAA